ncbi:MAG: TraB/GumN family protein [Gammaproteobacteria bacterium]|nr:TraB/GumN family protein [Gammaproteobacteria bacterium]MDH5628770.1 TraB/GumN family protein [Gammaproteobacteria bacterium]
MKFNITQKIIRFFLTLCFGLTASSSVLADNGKPDFWKVENNDVTAYIFGSIHMGNEAMYPLPQEIQNAYHASKALVVEVNLTPQVQAEMMGLIQKYGMDMQVSMDKRLSAEGFAVFQKACKEKQLPCHIFNISKPWLASQQISVMDMQLLGYKEELGIDRYFLSMAQKTTKEIISLETAEDQLQIMDGFSEQQQEMMLMNAIKAKPEDYKALFDAWQNGDDNAMISTFKKDLEQPGAKEMYLKLFDERNVKMADKIAKLINSKKPVFVVVGAGHVVGENGLVNLLKEKGFKLTQLQ